MICVAILVVGIILFMYLSWHVSPNEIAETVTIIANTESGCIGETNDGFAINIGPCNANAGDMITAMVDEKYKQREAAMNP